METKLIEVRDEGTMMVVLGVKFRSVETSGRPPHWPVPVAATMTRRVTGTYCWCHSAAARARRTPTLMGGAQTGTGAPCSRPIGGCATPRARGPHCPPAVRCST